VCRAILAVCVRRIVNGPSRPGWNWVVELGTEILKRQLVAVFRMRDVNAARRYLDSIVITSPALSEVNIEQVTHEQCRGSWFIPKKAKTRDTLLYFHGGGYSFFPRAYDSFIALITMATKCRTFALDYRLSPEHRFPAQLEDALTAYRWLLETGTVPKDFVVAGDSAGGNLALALLVAARDSKLPMPALAIALSPATDVDSEWASLVTNEEFDFIEKRMIGRWADWFCDFSQRRDPLVSLLWADLRGLPPIYIQAGRAEILYDSIQAFADRAKNQGADVVLETWEDMNHVFQLFGRYDPQRAEALQRLAEVIDAQVAGGTEPRIRGGSDDRNCVRPSSVAP